ncbi:MAG: DUF5086 family protein [Methylococcales bacterium]|nr:DUF5086 family protein [Methylococcales bacterium]
MKTVIFLVILFFNYSASAEINLEANTTGIWSMPPTTQQNRWLIIHNLSEAQTTGIYHIEVIGRDKKAPVWKIKHLAAHIAIDNPALLKSIIKPLKKGDDYPESFDNALSTWQKENDGKGGAVCTTSVIECMK